MSQAVPAELPRDDTSRLGRALFYVQQQAMVSASDVVKAKLGTLIAAGRAMDLAVRLHGNRALNAKLVEQFAMLAGISTLEDASPTNLASTACPVLTLTESAQT